MPYCNGQFYRCYDGGAGVFRYPTILLHGLGGTHLSWPTTIRRINGQRIYALDLPGHGVSKLPACISLDSHISFLQHFITDMGFYSVNLVGHSMGGAIGYEFARQHPGCVRKLTLLSCGLKFPSAGELERYFSVNKTRKKAVQMLMDTSFHPSFPKRERRAILEPLQNTRDSVLYADAHICAMFNPKPFPRGRRLPVQIITGREDMLVPLSIVRLLSRTIGNAPVHIIENSGHMVIYEQTEQVRQHLIAFLEHKSPTWFG